MADKDRVSQVRDTLKKMQKNLECPICLELLSDPYTTQCGHPFCRVCIYTVISSNREARCPLCKEPISKRSMNENSRLGEIVEAVKQLEQAIIEDTGIPKTPPRPLPPHSHEATGSLGIALHSNLHPSPRKKPRLQSKQTKGDFDSSASTSSQAALSIFSGPPAQEPTVESDVRNDTTKCGVPKPGDRGGHGKLSIKRRRKKVKFSVEKPTALARKVPTSSPKMESAASSSRNLLNMFAEEERMESGYGMLEAISEQARMKNGNGNMEPVFIEEVHVSGSRNEDENEGSNYPARKKARLDSSPAKIDTVSSQEVPCSSQQLGHDVSRILETPAPQMGRSNFTISINRVILSNRFTIRSKFDSNKPNEREEKNRKNALDQIGSSQSVSTKVCAHQDILSIGNNQRNEGRPQLIAVAMTETPFVQASGLSGSSGVTRVMETPFISNVHVPSDDEEIITNPRISSDGDVEQCESILANETEIDMDNNNHTPTSDKIQSQTGIAENLFSNSILVKETQDTDHSSSDHDDSLATDGSCTVLGPTQVTSVSESQFSQSVTTPASKPRTVLRQSPQIIDGSSLNLQKVGGEHKLQTQHDRRSSNGSESSSTCSPVQSGGTVCIGETQFTKSESKLSPEERQTVSVPPTGICAMPLPPASPSEIQSPVIPLQNSAHLPHSGSAMQVSQQQPSGSVSKIAETQLSTSSDHDIVPSSQPSPTASKRQSAATLPKLPGLTTVQYRKPQPQATITDDRISLEQKEKEDTKQNCDSQTFAVQQSEVNGHSTKSPLKFFAVEQNRNEHTAESTTAVVPTQSIGSGACVNVPLSSMSLAYSSLQSQRASLQSQISSCVDLSSQQLEILRLEMEAKQREIDELEAALRQVEEEEREIQPETPAASTQSSVRSITAIAETMPSNTGQMVSPDHASSPEHCAPGSVENPLSGQAKSNTAIADSLESTPSSDIDRKRATSPECMDIYMYAPESIENPLSGHTKSLEYSQVAVRPDHVSTIPALLVTNSQVSREQRSMEYSQMRAPSSTISSQILSDGRTTMKIQAVKRIAPNSHQSEALEKVKSAQHQSQIEANPTVTSEDLHAHVSKVATNYSFVGARSSHVSKTTSSLHSETETDTESDIGSEAPCTSQSVLATLQAADDVLRKLRSPPLAVLEERSSMEIDTDLYSSGTPAPHKQSLKAKKLRISTDSAKPTCVSDKVQTALVQKDSTLEVDAQLCTNSTKEEISAKSGKGSASTSRGKRAHSTSTKLKSKKTKKAPLVVYESEDAAVTRLPEFRNQNQVTTTKSSSNTFTDAKPSGLHPSSPCLPSITQSPDQGHCNREGGRGSTTPTYGAVVLRTPKAQCSSNSGTTSSSGKEVPAVSPCRLLSRIGKDHPPSYIGSGLSKTQLREVQALARRHGGRLASCFNGNTSHVIVSADENGLCSRTVKYLQGVATGRWIISHQWVTESLDAGRLLPESKYEIVGDHVTTAITQAPMRSRKLHLKQSPGLFADYAFLFIGTFGSISQDHLAQLILLSGGCLVSSVEESTALGNSTTCVVCDEKRFMQLPSGCGLVQIKSKWILDCLSNYSVLLPISSS